MSIHHVSGSQFHGALLSTVINPRMHANNDDQTACISTALKIGVVTAVLLASFVLLGPLVGLTLAIIAGGVTALYLSNSCSNSQDHSHRSAAPQQNPWFQRAFSFFPTYSPAPQPLNSRRGPHVPVGQGHFAPPPQNWFGDFLSSIPAFFSSPQPMNGNHVPVGRRNHNHGNGHVPVGSAPQSRHGSTQLNRPNDVPPPSGASNHVPIGRRHHHED